MKRRDELLVGLLLLAALVVGLGGTIWIARGGLSKGYPMHASFPWGAGLKQGQAVLLAGVQVGFIDKVRLIPDGTIAVTMQIQDEHRVPEGTTAAIEPNGIFGDQLIALTPERGRDRYLPIGDTIPVGEGTPSTSEILSKGDSIAANVLALTTETRSQFVADSGLRDVRRTVTDVTKLVAQLSQVVAAQSAELTRTQEQLRKTLASVDSAKVDSTTKNLQATSASLEALTRELRVTNQEVQGLVTKINTGNGTVGKLMNDPALYARLDTLLLRTDSLVTEFKKNPRKFINLKIF